MTCSWTTRLRQPGTAWGWGRGGRGGGRPAGVLRMARSCALSGIWGKCRRRGACRCGGSPGGSSSGTGRGFSSWCRRDGCTGSSRWRKDRCCWLWTSPGRLRRSCHSRSGWSSRPPEGVQASTSRTSWRCSATGPGGCSTSSRPGWSRRKTPSGSPRPPRRRWRRGGGTRWWPAGGRMSCRCWMRCRRSGGRWRTRWAWRASSSGPRRAGRPRSATWSRRLACRRSRGRTALLDSLTITREDLPGLDPDSGEIPDFLAAPDTEKPAKPRKGRNTVFDDDGAPAAGTAG